MGVKGTSLDELPGWLAPVVYAAAVVLLFREVVFAGGGLLGIDSMALSYFARHFYTSVVGALGRFPLWDPLLFGGLPFVQGMHGDIFYPPSLALFALPTDTYWAWKMILHVYAAGLFSYLWLRALEVARGPALLGGLIFMMGADLVSLVFPGGDGKLFVSALAPLVFWLAERAARRDRLADYAWFALGITAVVLTSHMQLAYFCVWGVSLYFLFRVAQRWRVERSGGAAARRVGLYAVAGVLGVAAAAVQFVPPLEYLRETSHRAERTLAAEDPAEAYAYSTSFALHPEELFALVVPEFVGDNAGTRLRPEPTYWGRNGFKLNHEYAGLVPLLLAGLLFIKRRRALSWFFAGLAVLSLLYALGANTPFFRLFYLIPGVNLFRAPSLIIFLYGLAVATLGALGAARLFAWSERAEPAEGRGATRWLWGATAGLVVMAMLASSGALVGLWQAVFSWPPPQFAAALQNNLPNIRTGAWIAALLAAGVAGTWSLLKGGVLRRRDALILLGLLAFVDLYRVDRRFVRATVEMNAAADPVLFQPDASIGWLQARQSEEGPFRAFDLSELATRQASYGQNVMAIHGIEQLAGHHGNEIGRWRELLGGERAPNVGTSDLRLLDLTNTRYVTLNARVEDPRLEEVFQGDRTVVYRVRDALPRAWLVAAGQTVPEAAAVERLLAADFDPRTTVLLPEDGPDAAALGIQAGGPAAPFPGEVTWQARAADGAEMTLRVRADAPAVLVVSENWTPGWRATLDGADVPVHRVNHTFRGVAVPAGEHTVRLSFEPPVLAASALVSVLVLLGLLAVGLAGELRRPRAAAPAPTGEPTT